MRRNEYEADIAARLDKETIGTLCQKGQSSCLNAVSRESKIVASERQLRERLQNLQLRSVKIPDDGNCQFRACSKELFGTEIHYARIRSKAVAYLQKHKNQYASYFETEEFNKYLLTMAQDKTWGDEFTLRAICDAFNVKIHVITSEDNNWYLQYTPAANAAADCMDRSIFLSYIYPIHYQTLELELTAHDDNPPAGPYHVKSNSGSVYHVRSNSRFVYL